MIHYCDVVQLSFKGVTVTGHTHSRFAPCVWKVELCYDLGKDS